MTEYNLAPIKIYDTSKLGIDAQARWYYVARQLDGATPQPVHKMDLDGLLHFVAKQQCLAREVYTGRGSRRHPQRESQTPTEQGIPDTTAERFTSPKIASRFRGKCRESSC